LLNDTNEIGTLSRIYRGGALSIYDKDSENNGLSINSSVSEGTNANAVKIETLGALNHGGNSIYGQGVTLSGASITGSGTIQSNGADLVLRANGGDITLTGNYYTYGTNNELIIQGANNVQLGNYTRVDSSALDLGTLGTSGVVAGSQAVSGASNLTLTSGMVTLTNGQQ
ncbi:MAG: hypothetical protein J0653_03310, partial [Deltaproteobacteria bacterium]|nr:hypothetical protein [Deltaproteobacteria bacterium]